MIARGFLIRDHNHRFKLSAPAFACLSACADPEKSIIIRHTIQNGSEEDYFFHAARKMRVIHTLPITAIHQFIAVEDDLAWNKAILSVLKIERVSKAKCEKAELDMSVLNKARDFALNGKIKEAEDILKTQIGEDPSSMLSKALSKPISNTTVAFVGNTKKEVDGFSIFQSKDSLWLLKPTDSSEDSKRITIYPVESRDLVKEVQNWF